VNFGLGGLLAMVAGALVLGLLAWPLHRAGWGLLGGAIFAVAAALLVKSQTASAVYVYVAAGAAFIAGLVLMVLLVRPLVILVTSVLGAVVVVGAVLALVPLVPSFAEPVTSLLQGRPETAVILVAVLAALGFFLQWRDTSPVAARAAPRGKAGDGHS
jgi:O-antigen ligase